MWMIIDDVRDLNCDIIARTSQAGFSILSWIWEDIECLVLDHDLGKRSYKNGNDLLKDLIAYGYLPNRIQLCSANPVGLNNQRNQLLDIGYTTKDGGDFVKK